MMAQMPPAERGAPRRSTVMEALRAGFTGRQINSPIRSAYRRPSPLGNPVEWVGVWQDGVKAPAMRPVALGRRGVERRLPPVLPAT
jgi:hypothetical protein